MIMGADLSSQSSRTMTSSPVFPIPFSTPHGPFRPSESPPSTSLPAYMHIARGEPRRPYRNPATFLEADLNLERLNAIHQFLWLAGLLRPARPLHRHLMLQRELIVAEQMDMHLVWTQSRMYIKPLPNLLLCAQTWRDVLCRDPALYKAACGFLLSYVWIVANPSDLRIAQDMGLLDKAIGWDGWTDFVEGVLDLIEGRDRSEVVNERFKYGELRLTRLSWICRLGPLFMRGKRDKEKEEMLRHGYFNEPSWYALFLRNNFGWFIIVAVYVSLVLSSMQVGLATERLAKESAFVNACYGFVVFAMLAPVIVAVLIIIMSAGMIASNVIETLLYHEKSERHWSGGGEREQKKGEP